MKPKRLIKELEKQLRKDVNNLVVRLKLAAAYREVGRVGESVELYRSVALAYHESGRPAQAMAVCRSVLEIEPGEPQTLQLLAALDQQAQQPEPSAQHAAHVNPGVSGPRLLHGPPLPLGSGDDSRRASSADVVEERDTAEREKWVPSLAPRAVVPSRNAAARGKEGSFSSPGDEYSMTPTPLPEPLSPHDADRENSVVESQIRRYPLPMDMAPDEPLPRVDLPADLAPVDDDLLPTDEHASLDIPLREDLVTSAARPGVAAEASHPASRSVDGPVVALYQEDEITELASHDALLQGRPHDAARDRVGETEGDEESRRPTTPLPMTAVPARSESADETAETGRHRRGEAQPRPGAGDPGDSNQQERIARIAAQLESRGDLGAIGDTVPEEGEDGSSQSLDTDSGVIALDTGEVIIEEDDPGRDSSPLVEPPGGALGARPSHNRAPRSDGMAAGMKAEGTAPGPGALAPGLRSSSEARPDGVPRASSAWNDGPTSRYDGLPRAEPVVGTAASKPRRASKPDERAATPSSEQVTRRVSSTGFDEPGTTDEEPVLTLEQAQAAMARDAIERRATTDGRDEFDDVFDDVTEGDAQMFHPAYEPDELTAADASVEQLSRRRDGLPVVIHDDMELGDAFHIALGAGEQPLGEVRAPLSIFSSLPREAVSDLAERMVLRHFDPDQFIVREGDASETCYVIVSGEVVVLRNDPIASEPIEVVRLDDGSLFGELALLANRHRRASVRAVNECHAYEIPRRLLRELAASYLEVGPTLERIYRDRLLASTVNTAPFLRNLPEVEIDELRDRFQTVRYDIGQPIIREGSRGGGFYLIAVGSVDITRRKSEKRSKLISTLDEGAYFADMALSDGDTALVTISAAAPTELITLSPEHFYRIIEKSPDLWRQIRAQGRCPELEENQILSGETYLT